MASKNTKKSKESFDYSRQSFEVSENKSVGGNSLSLTKEGAVFSVLSKATLSPVTSSRTTYSAAPKASPVAAAAPAQEFTADDRMSEPAEESNSTQPEFDELIQDKTLDS